MLGRSSRRSAALVIAAAIVLAGCTGSGAPDAPGSPTATSPGASEPTAGGNASSEPVESDALRAEVQQPSEPVTVLTAKKDDAGELALQASATFFVAAPVVVLAQGDDDVVLRAASAALALGAPLLLTDDRAKPSRDADIAAELDRLGTESVLSFGGAQLDSGSDAVVVVAPDDDAELASLLDVEAQDAVVIEDGKHVQTILKLTRGKFTPLTGADPHNGGADSGESAADPDATEEPTSPSHKDALAKVALAAPLTDVLVAATKSDDSVAALTTAIGAGANAMLMPSGDPRQTGKTVRGVAEREPKAVVGIGAAFKDAETFEWRLAAAATGVELPGGGQLVFPGKRYVALYGTPHTAALGVLGEQNIPKTIARAKKVAKPYKKLTKHKVIPALEIIATVASASAGEDGDYSTEIPPKKLRKLIDAAHDAGQYVVLDLQPGRASFLDQAKQYEELLKLPYVGLALDPEWNLGPDQVHLRQIGSAKAKEINKVVHWLADLTRDNALPQKMLVLHQFQIRMIQSIDDVDTSRSELAVLVHVDGQGTQPAKQSTWRALHTSAPNIDWWGWKNFYDEDSPMLTPKQTAKVKPFPNFISYQ